MPEHQPETPTPGSAQGPAQASAPPAQRRPTITCSCPVCGQLELEACDFALVVCASDAERSFYQFTCPRCASLVTKHASERIVSGLSGRGVPVGALPAEALEGRSGPALTVDDLLDLLLELERGDIPAAAGRA